MYSEQSQQIVSQWIETYVRLKTMLLPYGGEALPVITQQSVLHHVLEDPQQCQALMDGIHTSCSQIKDAQEALLIHADLIGLMRLSAQLLIYLQRDAGENTSNEKAQVAYLKSENL